MLACCLRLRAVEATTLRTYVHSTEGSARRAALAMGEALG